MKKLILLLVAGCLALGGLARAQDGLPPYDVLLRYYLNIRTGRGSVTLAEDRKAYLVMVYFFVDGREVNRHDLGLNRIEPAKGRIIDVQLILQYTPEQRFTGALLLAGEVQHGEYGNVVRDNITSQVNWWSKLDGPLTEFKTGQTAGQYNGYDIVITAATQEPVVGGNGKDFFQKSHHMIAVGVKSTTDPIALQNEISVPRNMLDMIRDNPAPNGNLLAPPPAARPATPPPPARPAAPAGARPGSPGAAASPPPVSSPTATASQPPGAPAAGGPNILQ